MLAIKLITTVVLYSSSLSTPAATQGYTYQCVLYIQYNHHNKRDVALFDFTSIHQTEHAAKAVKRGGKILHLCLAGDALLEVRQVLCHVML